METPADWYAPGCSAKTAAAFSLSESGDAEIRCADGRRYRARWRDIQVSPRLAGVPRRVEFPGGGWACIADNDFIDRQSARAGALGGRAARALYFLESRLWMAPVLLILALAVAVAVVRHGIPAAAELVAANLPGDAVARIGDDFYQRLQDYQWLQPSKLSETQRARARAAFDEVAADFAGGDPFHYRLRLHTFSFGHRGPPTANALAFPSGIVVMTDRLVEIMPDSEHIKAVAAHEIGHIRGRHTLRLLIQNASVLTLFGLLIGDVSGLALAPVVLAQLQYSRNFETEADCFAYRYLAARGIAWEVFGEALARIEDDDRQWQDAPPDTPPNPADRYADEDAGAAARLLEFLSTHPPSAARADPAAHCPAGR
ncbi:MAG: M48 family metallopeptidase [Gammaproteobacteria bacterium]|nr:M48 family metallopeptidase [Gammaproteobacteria bacterium]MDD9874817.1 M48 family metallopeptidase [Gammaproteobacteria bacterium]